MTAATVVFWLLSALTVSSAVMVVTTPHVVHAALWLVVTLGSVAGCFLVMKLSGFDAAQAMPLVQEHLQTCGEAAKSSSGVDALRATG